MTSAESSVWVSGEVVEAGQGQAEKTVQESLEVTLAEGQKLHGELTWWARDTFKGKLSWSPSACRYLCLHIDAGVTQ